ncbi:MAG: RDD family protein [Planctomycetota bacterium]|nr:RDD family protein [Planctomycetaceae bacterium]MDQ3329635.1 RDD family protein [Planctomycetota bacterium]
MIAPVSTNPLTIASAAPPIVDLGLRIETPENVVLTYTLAGPTLRAGAYLIDFALQMVLLTLAAGLVFCAAFVAPNIAFGLLLVFWFALSWWYFTLFEALWNGRTPGKWAVGLRVIQDKGYPVTFWAAVGRNFLRAFDSWPFYAPAFVSMLLNRRFKRLGDLLGRTVVVCERNVVLPREPVIVERIDPLPRDEISGRPPEARTLSLIDQFLGRRHLVSIPRGHDIARPLALALAKQLRYSGEPSLVEDYPMAFLARVYVTYLRRDEEEPETTRWAGNAIRPAAVVTFP